METHTEAPTFSTETDKDYPSLAGLTKREYFAAMAMQGLLANHQLVIKHDHADTTGEGYDFYEDIAEKAIIHAVCLIAELNDPT
jgi:hypothetical protein